MRWLSIMAIVLALQAGPEVTVSPDSGLPGTRLAVVGSGFAPGERVKILWDGANLGGTVRVGSEGTFEYSGVVPDGATPGAHSIHAQAVGGGTSSAETAFTVESAVTTTSTTPTTTPTTTPPSTAAPTTAGQVTATTSATTDEGASSPGGAGEDVSGAVAPEPVTPDPVDEPAVGGQDTSSGVEDIDEDAGRSGGTARPGADERAQSSRPTGREAGGGTWGLLLVAFIIIGGAAVTGLLLWGRSKDEPSEQGEARDPAVEEVAALPPLTAKNLEGQELGWSRHMMDLAPGGEITRVVATSAGLIAVGQITDADGSGEAAVWSSEDGFEWEGVARLGVSGALLAIPRHRGVLITASHKHERRMHTSCWHSEDGRDWQRLVDDSDQSLQGTSFAGGVATDEVVVAWGRDHDGPGVWHSRDGAQWQRAALSANIDLIASTEEGLLAFGRSPDGASPLVVSSPDGVTWDEVGRDSHAGFGGISAAALVSFQGGMVVAGTDLMQSVGAILVSDDAASWHRVPLEPGVGTSIEHLAVVDGRLVALGADTGRRNGGRGRVVAWESRDAVSWTRMQVTQLFADSVAHSAIASEQSLRVFGALRDHREGADADTVPIGWEWSPLRGSEDDSAQDHPQHEQDVDHQTEPTVAAVATSP